MLTKAPSAELRPDQRDDESLPPYSVLDPVVAGYVEGDRSPDDLIAEGFDPEAVARVVGLVDRAEYKRRQMPPGVRISRKAFGKDRRMPITNHYRPGTATSAPGRAHRTGRRRRLSELSGQDAPATADPAACPARSDPAARVARSRLRPDPAGGSLPLSLGETAALVGEYRWIENALYGLLGEWVTDMPVAAVQVHLDAQSLRHAWHAELWSDRLPVLAGATPTGSRSRRPPVPPCSPPSTGPTRRRTCPARHGRRPARSPPAGPGPCPVSPASTGWCCPAW